LNVLLLRRLELPLSERSSSHMPAASIANLDESMMNRAHSNLARLLRHAPLMRESHASYPQRGEGASSKSRKCQLPRTPAFPDVGRLCVIVPNQMESRLHFSARLDNGTPEVRLERKVRY
jgi:hypothetical protein